MNCKRCLVLAGLALLALPWATAQAGPRIGVGVYVGGPYYYGPYYGGYYYYRPYVPVYVAPAPTIVVQSSTPPAAAPLISTTPIPPGTSTVIQPTTLPPPQTAIETRGDEIDRLLSQLGNPDEKVRADVAIRLGRMRARRAAEPLEGVLASDKSAEVRDASARALGLIGAPASLAALQRAAQGDDDRGVRSSAQFAVDVIRSR